MNRGRARGDVRDFSERAGEWTRFPPPDGEVWAPTAKAWFLRFSVADRHDRSGRRTGIFAGIYRLLNDDETSVEVSDRVRLVLDWFDGNLIGPDIDDEAAIFFFKSTHGGCLSRAWSLAEILRDEGRVVEFQARGNPGRVVYEDDLQVAVVPWADGVGL